MKSFFFVIQIYDSKQDYEEVVVCMFQNKPIDAIPFKAYKLNMSFKCGPTTHKPYPGKPISFFWLKNPESKTKVLKIGCDNASVLAGLRASVAKYTAQG